MTEQEAIAVLDTIYCICDLGPLEGKAIRMGIDALYEIQRYRALGTVEELREAREKQVPKKPEYKILKSLPTCPNCGEVNLVQENEYGNVICNNKFCPDCGQAIDWSDAE